LPRSRLRSAETGPPNPMILIEPAGRLDREVEALVADLA
jgi:hypothetical protein